LYQELPSVAAVLLWPSLLRIRKLGVDSLLPLIVSKDEEDVRAVIILTKEKTIRWRIGLC
jgi:hypothetical protein